MREPQGLFWQDVEVGDVQLTRARTVTETDLVSFVAWFGYNERLFLEADYATAEGYTGRLCPGMFTLAMAEGMALSTGDLYGTGMAFMGAEVAIKAPVYVGDTLRVRITVESTRATKSAERGLVVTANEVLNQRDEVVLVYHPARLVRSRPGA